MPRIQPRRCCPAGTERADVLVESIVSQRRVRTSRFLARVSRDLWPGYPAICGPGIPRFVESTTVVQFKSWQAFRCALLLAFGVSGPPAVSYPLGLNRLTGNPYPTGCLREMEPSFRQARRPAVVFRLPGLQEQGGDMPYREDCSQCSRETSIR